MSKFAHRMCEQCFRRSKLIHEEVDLTLANKGRCCCFCEQVIDEFSLLVHTINGHLEETRTLSDDVTQSVTKTLLQTDPPDSDAGAKLDQVLVELDSLRTLPEKITAILTAADEINQHSINRSIEKSTAQVLERIEQLK